MSRVATKEPMGQKDRTPKKDKHHLGRVASLPCCICYEFSMEQRSRTTLHHVTHGRFSNEKEPDTRVIPLCDGHHQGDFDTSKIALHREHEQWKQHYGEDTEWVAWVHRMLEMEA